jgi:hypothetical protein
MTKPISTKAHGVLDYLSAGTLLALPRLLGWTPKLTTILTGSAIMTLAASLLTRYEWGLVKVLPMRGHLALDGLTAAAHMAVPFLLLDEEDRTRGNALPILLGFAAFETAAAILTRSQPGQARTSGNPDAMTTTRVDLAS